MLVRAFKAQLLTPFGAVKVPYFKGFVYLWNIAIQHDVLLSTDLAIGIKKPVFDFTNFTDSTKFFGVRKKCVDISADFLKTYCFVVGVVAVVHKLRSLRAGSFAPTFLDVSLYHSHEFHTSWITSVVGVIRTQEDYVKVFFVLLEKG